MQSWTQVLLGCLAGKEVQITKKGAVFKWAPVHHPAIGQGTRSWKLSHTVEENENQVTHCIAYCQRGRGF